MDLPAVLFKNPTGHPYWDTGSVHEVLSGPGEAKALRSTERVLEKADWLPKAVQRADLRDEQGRGLINLVADGLEASVKKKRVPSLFVQAEQLEDGFLIMANDGRGGRRWVYSDSLDAEGASVALDHLTDGKPAWIWPHGAFTAVCRELQERLREVAQSQ